MLWQLKLDRGVSGANSSLCCASIAWHHEQIASQCGGPPNDKWMKETAAAIAPGTAALFVLVRKATADKVLERLKGEGGTVMKTSLDHTKEAGLQAALAEAKAAVPA